MRNTREFHLAWIAISPMRSGLVKLREMWNANPSRRIHWLPCGGGKWEILRKSSPQQRISPKLSEVTGGVENCCHWVHDVISKEDESRARSDTRPRSPNHTGTRDGEISAHC